MNGDQRHDRQTDWVAGLKIDGVCYDRVVNRVHTAINQHLSHFSDHFKAIGKSRFYLSLDIVESFIDRPVSYTHLTLPTIYSV